MAAVIWGCWYNLADADVDRFAHWLHTVYLPELKALPGIAWAAHYKNKGYSDPAVAATMAARQLSIGEDSATPRGTDYLVVVGGTSPEAFFAPSIMDREAKLTGEHRAMLDLRHEARHAIFAEVARVTGPAADRHRREDGPAPVLQFGQLRTRSAAGEHYLAKWYATERMPDMARMPGSVGASQLACIVGWAKLGIFYEFASETEHFENFEKVVEAGAVERSRQSGRVSEIVHAPGSPSVALRLWPAVR